MGGPEPQKAPQKPKSQRNAIARRDAEPVTIELLDEAGARKLTDQIKATASDLWRLLEEAHRREAWRALGYESWSAYVDAEFDFSKRKAYALVEYGRFVKAIGAPKADADSNVQTLHVQELPSQKATEAIRTKPELVEKTRRRVAAGMSLKAAVERTVAEIEVVRDATCEHDFVRRCRKCGLVE